MLRLASIHYHDRQYSNSLPLLLYCYQPTLICIDRKLSVAPQPKITVVFKTYCTRIILSTRTFIYKAVSRNDEHSVYK